VVVEFEVGLDGRAVESPHSISMLLDVQRINLRPKTYTQGIQGPSRHPVSECSIASLRVAYRNHARFHAIHEPQSHPHAMIRHRRTRRVPTPHSRTTRPHAPRTRFFAPSRRPFSQTLKHRRPPTNWPINPRIPSR
jgi:hypothetical protein